MPKWGWWALGVSALAIFFKSNIQGLIVSNQVALANPNVQAFLAMIRHFESGGDYSILYGGGHFDSYAKHPDIRVPFFNPETQRDDFSTAAGAYQINYPTYLTWNAIAMCGDFSPSSQDALAITGLKLHGVLPDIMAGNFASAVAGISNVWASMPGSQAQQHPARLAMVQQIYEANGGLIA